MLKLLQSVFKFVSNPSTHRAIKTASHTFRKFPTQHSNKAVEAAFKIGVAVGKKKCKIK